MHAHTYISHTSLRIQFVERRNLNYMLLIRKGSKDMTKDIKLLQIKSVIVAHSKPKGNLKSST